MRRAFGWLFYLSAAAIMIAAACSIEQFASAARQASMLRLAPTSFDGFYGQEESTTLPGVPSGERRTYRWTRPASQFLLWPRTAGSSVLDLEYLNPIDVTLLRVNQYSPIALPKAPSMRRLHLLLPAFEDLTIRLEQTAPTAIDGRQLGMIVSDVEWSVPGAQAGLSDPRVYARLLVGLPATLALLGLLGWLARLSVGWVGGGLLLALAGAALLTIHAPWDVRAMQPALQLLLVAALAGLSLFHLKRRVAFLSWTALLVGVWCLSLLVFFSPDVTSDGVGYYAYLRSAFVDGDLNFTDEFDPQQSPFTHTPMIIPAPRPGYLVNSWSVGPALFWAPFWLVGHAIVGLGRQIGLGWQADGYAPPYVAMIALASALAGLATMLGCFKLLTRWFTPQIAATAAISLYLGSNLLYYAQIAGSFAHSLAAATATWFVLAALRLDDDPSLRRWLWLGLAAGAMLVTYWITALLLILPLAVGLRQIWLRARQRDRVGIGRLALGACVAAGVAVLVFAPQLVVWKLILGSWFAIPQGSAFATPQRSHLVEALFGSLYGIAWWTPAYFLGLLGSLWFARRRPWPGVALFAAGAAYLIYNASLPDWHGSGGFGMRRLTAGAPLFAIGLAALFERARRYRPLPAMLAGMLIVWSIAITLRYIVYQLPHEPFRLQGLGLRPILLSPELFPVGALARVSWSGWFGVLLRTLDVGRVLTFGVGLLAAGGVVLLRRRWGRVAAKFRA
jgi:hypothetical protein